MLFEIQAIKLRDTAFKLLVQDREQGVKLQPVLQM
jgi:hypothetical protein